MEIVKPSHEILDVIDGDAILKKLELCGRVAYKSEDKITPGSAKKFIRAIVDRGHESVIEHTYISVRLICDRGVTHEIVRHRIVSYTQESTRYCDYFKRGVRFIQPPWVTFDEQEEFEHDLLSIEGLYNKWLMRWSEPQKARYWLINGLKTEIVCTANLREWRHILKLRTSKAAHPQMRELMIPLLQDFKCLIPVIFDDIEVE